MDKTTSRPSRFWERIGQISVIVGIIWGVIRIIGALSATNEYDIKATGYCSKVVLPDSFYQYQDDIPDPVKTDLERLGSIWWITIENKGTKEVTDMSVELPFDGHYKVEQVGATSVFTDFQKIIDIGSLRPSNKAYVTIWAGPAYFPMSSWCTPEIRQETKITHPNGIVGIQYTERVSGPFYVWAARNAWVLVTALAIALSAAAILALVLINRPTKDASSSQMFSFTIDATCEEGLDTGIYLQAGQRITILGEGQVSINNGHQWIDPDGRIVQGKNEGSIRREKNTYLDDSPEGGIPGALIGWIGEARDETAFLAGKIYDGKAPSPGNLYLGVNDTRGAYSDNTHGGNPTSFRVRVIVEQKHRLEKDR